MSLQRRPSAKPQQFHTFGFCGRKWIKSFNFCVEERFPRRWPLARPLPGVSTVLKPGPEPSEGGVRHTQTYKTQVHWNGADLGQLSSILPHRRSVLSQPSRGSLSLLPATGEPGKMREVPGCVSGLPEETYSAFLFI